MWFSVQTLLFSVSSVYSQIIKMSQTFKHLLINSLLQRLRGNPHLEQNKRACNLLLDLWNAAVLLGERSECLYGGFEAQWETTWKMLNERLTADHSCAHYFICGLVCLWPFRYYRPQLQDSLNYCTCKNKTPHNFSSMYFCSNLRFDFNPRCCEIWSC